MELRKLFSKRVYFVSGIDTDAGKTIATGWLSRELLAEGVNVITQKLVQTGNIGMSEDIKKHREIEGRPLLSVDLDHTTNPLLFKKPCSPHMAAELEGSFVDLFLAEASTNILSKKFELVLLEGAGGLMVPLQKDLLSIDYANKNGYPVILVTTAKLGSINHTLLSMEALEHRGMELTAVIYNEGISTDDDITLDTYHYLKKYISTYYPTTALLTLPQLKKSPQTLFRRLGGNTL